MKQDLPRVGSPLGAPPQTGIEGEIDADPAPRYATYAPPAPRLRPRSYRWPLIGLGVFVLAPTLAAAAYFYGLAADRYVADLRYSIRGGATLSAGDQLATAMGAASALATAGDSFILEDYLLSAQAIVDLEARVPLREMLGRDGGDWLRGYDPAAPIEDLLGFWSAAIDVSFDVVTGITNVHVRAYTPQDALAIGGALVDMLRVLVDRLSEEARNESLAYVDGEYVKAEARLAEAAAAIEAFRRANELVSPSVEAELGSATIAQLTNELTDLLVRLRTLRQNVPNSPQIPTIEEQVRSLKAQIGAERQTMGGAADPGALPGQLMDFQRLENEYAIARENYVSTLQLRQQAEANATLSQVQLVVFVPPRLPVLATEPQRAVEVLQIFGLTFLVWLMGRVLLASLRTP